MLPCCLWRQDGCNVELAVWIPFAVQVAQGAGLAQLIAQRVLAGDVGPLSVGAELTGGVGAEILASSNLKAVRLIAGNLGEVGDFSLAVDVPG